ncbi:AMP-binding protein [bacterium]|nr:AMP-binding protein [bacterium]
MENSDQLVEFTIPQLLRWRTKKSASKIALREKDFGYWKEYTWKEYYDHVRKAALGLEALGIKKDSKIALIGDNIPEMLFIAIGAQSLGAISAGIYQTTLPEEIAQLIDYMDVTHVFCDDQEQVDKVIEIRDQIPNVKKVIYEDPRGMRSYRKDDWFIFINDLYKLGEEIHKKDPQRFTDHVDEGSPDDVCHLCLTSGTTGLSKGSMMTHRNYINMGVQLSKVDPLEPTDEYLSFLPFAWIGEQMNSFGVAMATGITINFPESVETAMDDLKEIGPHFMFGAPRIYENIRSQIWLKIDESYRLNRIFYNFFIKVGEKAASYRMLGKKMPTVLRIKSWFGTNMVFRPLINQIGLLRLRRAYTGGAALGPELFTFYQAIGVNLKQIYGQTEITGIAYMHRDGDIRPDTVGFPLPQTECKISEKGEILSRSPSVCAGYYKLPDKTREDFADGWLCSGDAGIIDKEGHLVVIDRLSDVMHNNKGELFSPMFLENKLKFSPYIKEAVILGDKKEFVSCLINIDPVIVGKWAEGRGISYTTFMDLSQKQEVKELMHRQVLDFNKNVEKEHYKIKRFAVLYKLLDVDDGELTKTGKIRRKYVNEKYDTIIATLYDEGVSKKVVEAEFVYQDGQKAIVETEIEYFTME